MNTSKHVNTNAQIQTNKNMKKSLAKRFFLFIGLVFLLSGSFFGGMIFTVKNEVAADLAKKEAVYIGQVSGKYSEAEDGLLTQDIDFGLFWEVWEKLDSIYVDKEKLNEKKMFYGALKGLASSLGDPYTVFMDPVVATEFDNDLAGTFEGIGAEIGIKNDILTIIAPLPDMPAEKAGLKAGDKVYAIDGDSTMGISVDEAVRKIRGEKNTKVTLTIFRDGDEQAKDIDITRGKIIVSSVRTDLREDNIYSIKVTNFNDDTERLFNKAIAEIIEKNPDGIILDLRNNPGGYLETAIEMASEWINKDIVVSEKFGDDRKQDYLSRGRARLADFKTVVLVNQGSASASEIVSGALQDYGLAVLVGKQTFGKGSVQTLEKLSDGSSLKVTVAKWLTPKGRSINDEGITPDQEVEYTNEDYENNIDPQYDRAVDILTGNFEMPVVMASSTDDMSAEISEGTTTSNELYQE